MQARTTKRPDTKKAYPLPNATPASRITPTPPKNIKEEKPYVLPATGYARLKQLLQIVPFSAATVWRKSKNGSFPVPVRLSEKITGWRVEDIRAWLDSKEFTQ